MKAFIVDRTYRVEDGKAIVYLFGRLANGQSFLATKTFKPYFYIRTSDVAKSRNIGSFEEHPTKLTTMQDEPVTKIVLETPKDVPPLRQAFEQNDIPCYEADIRFTQRFCMDHGIFATMNVEGSYEKGTHVDRVYTEPEISPADFTPELDVLSIDIETSLDGNMLYMITLTQGTKQVTLVQGDAEGKNIRFYSNEHDILKAFTEIVQEWDPDIITGWNLIDFDLQDIKKRCDKEKIPFVLGRTDWPSTLRIESQFIRDSTANIAGRMVLDGIHLMKSSFIRLDDYKLETAAQEFLGDGKLLKGDDRHAEIEQLYKEDRNTLIEYNRKDTELVLEILKRTKLIELTMLRSKLTGMTMERVRASIASFDSVYLRELTKHGKVAPNGGHVDTDERITGGYVRESKPGIYSYILVLDFKSMYPSVIRTFNIDPASYLPGCTQQEPSKEIIVSPNGACFRNTNGILPRIIQHLWEERDKAKKEKDAVASLALKTLMNSFFGVLASPNCRFFSLEMGNAITHFARYFIKMAAEKIEERGYTVIYGDTDSVFVETKATIVKDAERVGKELQEHINTFYATFVEDTFFRKNFMELEAEKVYRKFLMPRTRGSEQGAKKRYAGLLVKGDKEEMDFTGLEFVRRDWTEVSKKFQLDLLEKIFHEQEVTTYVKDFVKAVKEGKYDSLLVYRKSIRKDLEEYTKTTPQHVKAARILEEKEGLEGNTIKYVITKNGPEPVGYETAEIDYDHYIEKQIKPIADSVLVFYGVTFDELLSGQQSLFSY